MKKVLISLFALTIAVSGALSATYSPSLTANMAGDKAAPATAIATAPASVPASAPALAAPVAEMPAPAPADTVWLTLEDAIRTALSENASVKVADLEIERTGYARRGSYASLFPQVDGSGAYQRTIKKQVMYMDFDMSAMMGGGASGTETGTPGSDSAGAGSQGTGAAAAAASSRSTDGFEVGRWNTWSAGVQATMPLVNAQVWQSIKISGQDVELAVEKARGSRLETVTQVKKAFYTVLLAKEALGVYRSVYENAVENLNLTQKKYNAQRASELDLTRAKTTVANAVPNMYDAANSVELSLWQLKAVMGVDLDAMIDVAGSLGDHAAEMQEAFGVDTDLSGNSSLRQLAIQTRQLASTVKLQQYASLPSLALAFSYSLNAMTNDFKFSEYKWSPYSYVGLSLNIPIFAGGKRYNAVKAAKVQAAELDIQRANTERQLQIAIRQYLGTMETATKSYSSAASAVETASKAYSIARQSYDVGRSTLTDLGDAQLALTQSQLGVSQAIFNYLSAKSDLEGTLGADIPDNNSINE